MNVRGLIGSPPGRLWAKLNEDNAFTWAVVLAWNFLQSLFPIALVIAVLLTLAFGFLGAGSDQIYRTVASLIPDAKAQKDTLAALNSFHQRSGVFFVLGFVGLVWSGTGLFRAMEQAFAVIYHTRQRSLLKGILMSVGMVALLTVFGGLMLVTTTLLGLLNQLPLPSVLANGVVDFVLQVGIGALSGFVLYVAIYYVVPNRKMDWGSIWIGAALAALLFEGLSLIFPLYLRLTGAGSGYGKTFGLLFLLMLYFYYIGIVTMVGVEVNSLLYPVPVGQPQGKESLVTPIQGSQRKSEPAPLRAPGIASATSPPLARSTGRGGASRIKGIAALAFLWMSGTIRRRPRVS